MKKVIRIIPVLAGALCGAGLIGAGIAHAGEKRARLSVEVKVEGAERWRNGSDHAETRIAESFSFATTLRSDGELRDYNPKDPQYAQQMQERAARAQQRVQQAQAQQAQAQQARDGMQAARPATAQSQQEMMARMMQSRQECGGDPQCLHRIASQLSAQSVSADPALQARLTRYADDKRRCEQRHAADAGARRACLTEVEKRAGAYDGAGEDPDEDRRYLSYGGFDGCGGQLRVRIERTTAGAYADVQGMVPFTDVHSADARGSAADLRMLCLSYSPAVDVNAQRFHSDGLWLPEVRGSASHTERGRREQSDTTLSLRGEVGQWVAAQLRDAPVSGTRRATLPLGQGTSRGGQSQGSVNVEMSWRLEQI